MRGGCKQPQAARRGVGADAKAEARRAPAATASPHGGQARRAQARLSTYSLREKTFMSLRVTFTSICRRRLRRIRIARVVAEHVVVAARRVDLLQRLVEVVHVDDGEAAGLLGQHPQAVLRLAHVVAPLGRIHLLVDVGAGHQPARVDGVDRGVRAVGRARDLAELERQVGIAERFRLLLLVAPSDRCCAARRAVAVVRLFAITFDWFCRNGELGSRRPRRESWNGLKS